MERKAKGFAIMLVLMMLFLLFMLGVAFFFSAWTHAFMARNYLNMKRAFVVAEGGVHHAISNIIGDFVWASHAQNREVNYRWKYGNPGIPVEYALAPSYAMPRAMMILGQKVGLSGVMDPGGGAYGINSDIFHLKVNECSAQLYVNEGLGHPYNTAVIQRILNRLEEQILGLNHGTGTLGKRLIQNRPISGYESKTELKAILGQLYEKVKDLICVHTWSDPKVANPVPLSEEASPAYDPELYQTRPGYPNNIICRYGRGRINDQHIYPLNREPLNFGEFVYAWQELNPCYIQITSRAPVNINTAPRQILIALLCDLQGFFIMQTFIRSDSWIEMFGEYSPLTFCDSSQQIYRFSSTYSGPGQPGQIGKIYKTPPITPDLAEQIAERIIARRPFYRWYDFNRFIDELVWELDKDDVLIDNTDWIYDGSWQSMVAKRYASLAIADVIKANFNPNLHLNELNPDANLWGWVDKTDLIKNSTEFCFLPTGYFEIESVGQILRTEWEPGRFHISPYLIIPKDSFEHNNQIMGQRRLKVTVKLWDLYRQTTQKDFMQGTYSHSLEVPYRTNLNLACLSGPEPLNGYPPLDTTYEGYLCLSTIGGSMSKTQSWRKGKLYRTSDFKGKDNLIEEGTYPEITKGECTKCGGDGEVRCGCWWSSKCQQGWWPQCIWGCKCGGGGTIPCSWCGGDPITTKVSIGMHGHYEFDFRLHGAASHPSPLTDQTEAVVPADAGGIWGVADWTEREYQDVYRAPYCTRYAPERYRLCRDTRMARDRIAPSDLRMDGFYTEMYDYLPYYSKGGNFSNREGSLSYWIKPGFVPELDARIKFFSSISKGGEVTVRPPPMYTDHAKFMHIFGWMDLMKEDDPVTPQCYIRPYSMYFEVDSPFLKSVLDLAFWCTGVNTPTINHVYHGYPGPGWGAHPLSPLNMFLAHRWIHVALAWKCEPETLPMITIFVNGKHLPGTAFTYEDQLPTDGCVITDFTTPYKGGKPEVNPFMLGSSRWSQRSASSTMDEFYLFGETYKRKAKIVYYVDCPVCVDGKRMCNLCPYGKCHRCSKFLACKDNNYRCSRCWECDPCAGCDNWMACKSEGYRCRVSSCIRCRCRKCKKLKDCKARGYRCWWGRRKCFACPATSCRGCSWQGECRPQGYRCQKRACWTCKKSCAGCPRLGACADKGKMCATCYMCTATCKGCNKIKGCTEISYWCLGCTYADCEKDPVGKLRKEKTVVYFEPPSKALQQWLWGRYYRENDAVFTSGLIELPTPVERGMAYPNLLKDPYGHQRWMGEEALGQDEVTSWLRETWHHPKGKVLGIAWTGYTHGIRDYGQVDNPLLWAQLEVSLEVKDGEGKWVQIAGPFLGQDSGWAPIMVELVRKYPQVRYRVRFNTRCNPANAILLETPILDDVTIYWMTRPQWVSWTESY